MKNIGDKFTTRSSDHTEVWEITGNQKVVEKELFDIVDGYQMKSTLTNEPFSISDRTLNESLDDGNLKQV